MRKCKTAFVGSVEKLIEKSIKMQEAAVLVPFYRDDAGEIRFVLVRRTDKGIHGGEIAFPGGKRASTDQSLVDTALRETQEEIGIAPKAIEIVEPLPVVGTQTTRFRIYPFLARIVPPKEWCLEEREIVEILEVRISDLIYNEVHSEDTKRVPIQQEHRQTPFFRVGPYRVWGATYRILKPLIQRFNAD